MELSNLHSLGTIENERYLEEKIKEITHDFNKEVEKLKNSKFGKSVKRWVPIGTGCATSVFCSAIQQLEAAIASSVVGAVVQIYQELVSKQIPKHNEDVYQLMGNLKKSILKASNVRKIASSPFL